MTQIKMSPMTPGRTSVIFLWLSRLNLKRFSLETVIAQGFSVVILMIVAVHSGNYFYSAIQKILISAPPWSWVTQNNTHYLMAAAYESGSLPLSILGPRFVSSFYTILVATAPGLNALTLLIQLFPIIALRSTKLMILALALFDLTHIVIFLVTGIFFYKWIVLNFLLLFALVAMRSFSWNIKQYFLLVALMVVSPVFFFVSFLGWHDTPSFNDEYFLAHTRGGQSLRVPSNYFLSASVTYAQGRLASQKPGHFPTGPLGVLYSAKSNSPRWRAVQNCELVNGSGPISNLPVIIGRIRRHHDFVISKLDVNGRFAYDFFPHHIWSMPWEYTDFYELDKRSIIAYSHVIESKCLESPRLISTKTPITMARTTNRFEVR